MDVCDDTVAISDLIDAGAAVRGEGSEKQLLTAKNHFNKFLSLHDERRINRHTCDTIGYKEVTAGLISRFGTYLFNQLQKPSGALSYMSQIKTFFTTKWMSERRWELHRTISGDEWYKKIRDGMTKLFSDRAIAAGQSLVDQAPPMYRDSLRHIASCLFMENTAGAYYDRDLLVTQWHCMGRASETGLRHGAVRFIGKPTCALQFCVGRSKTSKLQYVHAFCDSASWEADIFHSKACHLLTCANVDDDFHFPSASAAVINRILARVQPQEATGDTKFQSHSSRRGCASEALAHGGVSVTEVIARGGWCFDSISRVFLYFSGMDRGDMRVGRVVAGWKDGDRGGLPAKTDCLTKAHQVVFQELVRHLFRHVNDKYEDLFLATLTASVLMYYNQVESVWNSSAEAMPCRVHAAVQQSLIAAGGDVAWLPEWSQLIYEDWLVANLPWLSTERVSEISDEAKQAATISVFTFQETIDHLVAGQHEMSKQLIRLNSQITEQHALISSLTSQITRLAEANAALSSLVSVSLQATVSSMPSAPAALSIAPSPATATSVPLIQAGPPRVLPASLKGMRASYVFLEFFSNRWYALPLLSAEKEIMRKIKLVVSRVQDFLPAVCVLTLPPPPGDTGFTAWHRTLREHALVAESRMIDYIAMMKPDAKKRKRSMLYATNVNKDLANASARADYPQRIYVDRTGSVN